MQTKTNTKPPEQGYRWYTYEEAAAYLGVTERQCRRWAQQGRLPNTKLGLRTLFSKAQLDAFVSNHTVGGAA